MNKKDLRNILIAVAILLLLLLHAFLPYRGQTSSDGIERDGDTAVSQTFEGVTL